MKALARFISLTAAAIVPALSVRAGPFISLQMMAQRAAHPDGQLVPLGEKSYAWATKALAEYPLDTCVVSGEKLDSNGKSLDYVYVKAGMPDRLVRFATENSVKAFEKDPAQYLRKLADAAKAASSKGLAAKAS